MLTLLLIWFVISIPASLMVGAFLALSSKSSVVAGNKAQIKRPKHIVAYSESVMAETS